MFLKKPKLNDSPIPIEERRHCILQRLLLIALTIPR